MNGFDLTALAQRITRALGIEPYLAQVFLPWDLKLGRFLVLIALLMWALALLTTGNAMLLRYTLQRMPGPSRERMVDSGRRLRRAARRSKRTGYVILILGLIVALLLLQNGVKYAMQSLVFAALIHFGVLQPAWVIAELYGRTFEMSGTPSK